MNSTQIKKITKEIGLGLFSIPYGLYCIFYANYPDGFPDRKQIEKAFNRFISGNQRQPNPTSLENTE